MLKNRLEYEKLKISTSFVKGREFLDITGSVILTDERTGFSKEGGYIRAIVISSKWTRQSFIELTAGIDEKLFNCACCLDAHNLSAGTVAFLMESEFVGSERSHEDRAFVDLFSFLQEVLSSDIIVTFLPFSLEVKKQQGFIRVWGPDKRSYSISYNAVSNEMLTLDSVEGQIGADEAAATPNWSVAPVLNRLRSVSLAEGVSWHSEGAKKVVELFKENENAPLTKQQILNAVVLNEDDLSMAMMELLDLDLLEEWELKEEEEKETQDEIKPIFERKDFLQAVYDREHSKVQELLRQPGVQVNDIDADGRNAMFIALENKDLDMVRLLLEAGIDPNYENEDGMTAIKICWLTRNHSAESLLREYGAELDI
ncbi:ankyrin repeat domain-containing protein [Paenibacillus oralis]|uniref:Ankyrin repeat domain-containing protein n=1 Tax=Paenibacillus oralis TaxID=2490856 RepID=A0A3P3T9I4_9BACL|nr:ankyrin repeat domain-containing protein [Paenibacillus oralis]RRJ54691.1 ankyrin repeat domain-containing protein [Paenibacillus oralis]